MKKIVFILSLMFISNLLVSNLYAQDDKTKSKSDVYNWDLTAKAGASLLWGDAASSYSPFTKWFSSECAFTGELVLNRRISNVFGIQAGFAKGVLSGNREVWSSETHPITTSKTDYFDYHLGLNIDITGIFNRNPNRFFSLYAFGGVGMINFNATSYLDGKLHQTSSGNTLMIPWGGGVRFRISPRFSLVLETNFRNTYVDDIDAYVGSGSEVNDIYSVTGLGLTYRFGQKKDKKREIDIVPIESADTAIAKNDASEYELPVSIFVQRGMPVTAVSDTMYVVKVKIQKDSLDSYGRYSQMIPKGFVAMEDNSNGGDFNYANEDMYLEWMQLPVAETLEFSYILMTTNLEQKTYVFEGEFMYEEDTAMRVKTFVDNIVVSAPQIGVDETTETAVVAGAVIVSGIDYRVQVAAVFGGKSSSEVIATKLRLKEDVYEDPYKRGYRYTVGHFDQYSAANSHLKNVPVNGAYVIAFVDGKYVGDLAKTNDVLMDKQAVNESGVTYKIQIAASKGRPYSIAKLANKYGLNPSDIYQDANGTYFMYTVGKYTNLEDAKARLNELRKKVKGAYIVKFIDGKRSR